MSLASGEHHNYYLLQYYYTVRAGSADIWLDLRVALRWSINRLFPAIPLAIFFAAVAAADTSWWEKNLSVVM